MSEQTLNFSRAFTRDLARMQIKANARPLRAAMLPQIACQAAFLTGEPQRAARCHLDLLLARVPGAARLEPRIAEAVEEACETRGESALEPFHIDRALRPWIVKVAAITVSAMDPRRSDEDDLDASGSGGASTRAVDGKHLILTAHGSEALAHGVRCDRRGASWFGATELAARHMRQSYAAPLCWIGLDAMRAMKSFASGSGRLPVGGPQAVLLPSQDGLSLDVIAESVSIDHPPTALLRRSRLAASFSRWLKGSRHPSRPFLLLDLDGVELIHGTAESAVQPQRDLAQYRFPLDGGVLLKLASLGLPRRFILVDLQGNDLLGDGDCPWIGVGTIDDAAIAGQPIEIYAPVSSAWSNSALLRLPTLDGALVDPPSVCGGSTAGEDAAREGNALQGRCSASDTETSMLSLVEPLLIARPSAS
jgi:hypothetical protein